MKGVAMNLLTRDELKTKIDNADDFKLVFVLGDWRFHALHIPGSLNIPAPEVAAQQLDPDDDIVVYRSNDACMASRIAHDLLIARGYKHVRRYAGGISDWSEAVYPVEGEMADAAAK